MKGIIFVGRQNNVYGLVANIHSEGKIGKFDINNEEKVPCWIGWNFTMQVLLQMHAKTDRSKSNHSGITVQQLNLQNKS